MSRFRIVTILLLNKKDNTKIQLKIYQRDHRDGFISSEPMNPSPWSPFKLRNDLTAGTGVVRKGKLPKSPSQPKENDCYKS